MNFLINLATNNSKHKKFLSEYRVGIIIVAFLRFLCGAIPIFAGYFYFANLLSGINSENPIIPQTLAILTLACVEILSWWLLSKLTKAVLNADIIASIILFVFAGATLSLSFVSSTNGLAMRQSQKADISNEIMSNYDVKSQNITANFETQIAEQKDLIKEIKKNPQGWKGNRRIYLTDEQLKSIEKINTYIIQLRNNEKSAQIELNESKKAELKDNRKEMTETADKYYLFMSIVLIVAAICNISIVIFYRIIYKEEKGTEAALSEYNNAKTKIFESFRSQLSKEFSDFANDFTTVLLMQNTVLTNSQRKESFLKRLTNSKNVNDNKTVQLFDNETKNDTETINHDNRGLNFNDSETVKIVEKTVLIPKTKQCKQCGKSFEYKSEKKEYCSTECRMKFHNFKLK